MLTVQGIYEKGTVQIKDFVPDLERCEVFVTFLPVVHSGKHLMSEPKLKSVNERSKAIDDLLGLCEGNTLTLDDIKRERLSRQ